MHDPFALPDLSGRTVVVTGASSGLGAVTARELARAGARVVLAVRDPARGRAAAEGFGEGMAGETEVRPLDLGDLSSVRAFAEGWSGPLDVLVNNAGIMAVPHGRTADGFELHLGTNHLGHFALTTLLLPHLTGRVVTVSSGLSRIGRIDLDDLNWEHRRYRPLRAYGQSKLANLLFSTELQRRLTAAGSPVLAVSAHPGVAVTSLDRHMGGLQAAVSRFGYRFIAQKRPEYGALPTLHAATRAGLPGDSYLGPDGRDGTRQPKLEKRTALDSDSGLARRLWTRSEELTGVAWPSGARA